MLRFGDHVAQISAAPVSPNLTEFTGRRVPVTGASALCDRVSDFFADQPATWEVRAQLATDLETTPVEDASVAWPEDVTPYRTVATLAAAPQDTFSTARRIYADDDLCFNPWHCLVYHQPLGSIQRVRQPVYYDDSSADRHDRNARPRREPGGINPPE